jgi:glycosyltransferase involved in cell wall biosynthesis
MSEHHPTVSIGLPVYNGTRYLEAAAESILGQTFTDLELIIYDNGSTDGTDEICTRIARRDQRVRLYRSDSNRGASWSYNSVFEKSTGRYFKWAAHDDWLAPEFIAACLKALERDSSVVLCHTGVIDIDEEGREIRRKTTTREGDVPEAIARFRSFMQLEYNCEEVFGLIRSAVLAETALIAPYPDSDRVLLSELGLRGRLMEVPEPLLYHRIHSEGSVRVFPGRHSRFAWFDPESGRGWVFPHWREVREFGISIRRSGVERRTRWSCYAALFRWALLYRKRLAGDLEWAARRLARMVVRGRAE